jgi:hypothetical protein
VVLFWGADHSGGLHARFLLKTENGIMIKVSITYLSSGIRFGNTFMNITE